MQALSDEQLDFLIEKIDELFEYLHGLDKVASPQRMAYSEIQGLLKRLKEFNNVES